MANYGGDVYVAAPKRGQILLSIPDWATAVRIILISAAWGIEAGNIRKEWRFTDRTDYLCDALQQRCGRGYD